MPEILILACTLALFSCVPTLIFMDAYTKTEHGLSRRYFMFFNVPSKIALLLGYIYISIFSPIPSQYAYLIIVLSSFGLAWLDFIQIVNHMARRLPALESSNIAYILESFIPTYTCIYVAYVFPLSWMIAFEWWGIDEISIWCIAVSTALLIIRKEILGDNCMKIAILVGTMLVGVLTLIEYRFSVDLINFLVMGKLPVLIIVLFSTKHDNIETLLLSVVLCVSLNSDIGHQFYISVAFWIWVAWYLYKLYNDDFIGSGEIIPTTKSGKRILMKIEKYSNEVGTPINLLLINTVGGKKLYPASMDHLTDLLIEDHDKIKNSSDGK